MTGTKFRFIVLVANAVARATGRTVRQGTEKETELKEAGRHATER
jgi:hypothetical protein